MFKICMPGWTRRRSATLNRQQQQQQQQPSVGSERSRDSTVKNSSLSTTNEFSHGTASKESNNSKDSQLSSSSTSSSLAGIRELLPDGPVRYRFRELLRGTDSFSEASKLGPSVFRANLRGAEVAIVRRKGSFVGNYVELINVISSVHHVNLVKLLGACSQEGDCVYLCYEYEPGVSLREALQSSKAHGYMVLSRWSSRVQVALDVALGLEYLHDHTSPKFVHKHVKSTNIIVTNDLRAKIAKFGIPQLTGEIQPPARENESEKADEEQVQGRKLTRSGSVKITGTPGYMSPEYMSTGIVSSKMDVYAYGVILLELITGQQTGVTFDPVSKKFKTVSLPDQVREVMNSDEPKKKLRLWMDPRLKDSYPVDTAFSVAALARQCVETDPSLRPPMKNVTAKLSNYLYSCLQWDKSYLAFRENQSQTMEGR